ncbi:MULTISPECIES: hypothetical protein [unclassified Ectothiorhodospira]|uniref:hypothetical protein n=1 Tax=unclassified Ectothiorhodospira TaxID=2684909 RepID=UPI001EE79347|nr:MULTISPECIES: hypothetical protein [unclassified Ectothiorhodospira]MCG5517220.1 hypothetical protein [Ectothiorhodospira sp. 9100]MCG5519953.1 hypothetical protein [Ectothiorhodospira sp. 9905]
MAKVITLPNNRSQNRTHQRGRKEPDDTKTLGEKHAGNRDQILVKLEELKERHGETYGRWRLNKRDRNDRVFLIQIARNLSSILDWLPRGKRGVVLEKTKSEGSARTGDANKYVTRVTVKDPAGDPEVLVKPLTPAVSKYIAIAKAAGDVLKHAPGSTKGPNDCLKRLFRGTYLEKPWHESPTKVPIWADHLAEMLSGVCKMVAEGHNVGHLFDKMTDANIFATDNGKNPEFKISDWLSETFDKHSLHYYEPIDGHLPLLESTEQGLPLAGLPIFAPRTLLFVETHDIGLTSLERVQTSSIGDCETSCLHNITDGRLTMRLETWIGIAPVATGHDEPCDTVHVFMLKPSLTLQLEGYTYTVGRLGATNHSLHIEASWSNDSAGTWKTTDQDARTIRNLEEHFIYWFDLYGRSPICLGWDDEFKFTCDVDSGLWWASIINGENVVRILDRPSQLPTFDIRFPMPETISWLHEMGDFLCASAAPLDKVELRLPPAETIARDLCLNLLQHGLNSHVTADLEGDAVRIRAIFEDLENKVCGAFHHASSRFFKDLQDYADRKSDHSEDC